jgi:hypothetical protein
MQEPERRPLEWRIRTSSEAEEAISPSPACDRGGQTDRNGPHGAGVSTRVPWKNTNIVCDDRWAVHGRHVSKT